MKYSYVPQGVCSRKMIFDIEDDIIKKVEIIGGCAGNTIRNIEIIRGNES